MTTFTIDELELIVAALKADLRDLDAAARDADDPQPIHAKAHRTRTLAAKAEAAADVAKRATVGATA